MWIIAVIMSSIALGIDIGNYAAFDVSGAYYLDMDKWYNSRLATIFHVAVVVLAPVLNHKKI